MVLGVTDCSFPTWLPLLHSQPPDMPSGNRMMRRDSNANSNSAASRLAILFTTDYPYGSMKAARPFFDHMPINANDREKIAHLNAERLLGLGQVAAHLRRAAE